MLREFVKWDYELRMSSQTPLIVDRAFGIAESAPTGPVYLSLPLEVLSAPFEAEVETSTQRLHPKFKKFVKHFTKFHAHDEKGEAREGDIVESYRLKEVKRTL